MGHHLGVKGSWTTPIGNPGSGGNYTVADPNSLSPASLETLDYREVMYRNDCSITDTFKYSNLFILFLIWVVVSY